MRSASKTREQHPNLRVTRETNSESDQNNYERPPRQNSKLGNEKAVNDKFNPVQNITGEEYQLQTNKHEDGEEEDNRRLRAAIEGNSSVNQALDTSPQKGRNEINTNSLKLLVKFVEYLKVKGTNDTNTLIILQERLIYTSSYLLEKGALVQDLPFDFEAEVVQFTQKVNLRAMEGGNKLSFEELIVLITKAIDMLLYKPVCSQVKFEKLLELRILCFNNLSCIYRQRKMFKDALKAVNRAIEMEEVLQQHDHTDSSKTIASTYINRSVIMSELGMHLESIETIKKALGSMDEYRKNWESSLGERDAFQLKYLSVIAYFNLAVEHEHLFYTQYAKSFYEIALGLSKELNYSEMTQNIETALKKMKKTSKK